MCGLTESVISCSHHGCLICCKGGDLMNSSNSSSVALNKKKSTIKRFQCHIRTHRRFKASWSTHALHFLRLTWHCQITKPSYSSEYKVKQMGEVSKTTACYEEFINCERQIWSWKLCISCFYLTLTNSFLEVIWISDSWSDRIQHVICSFHNGRTKILVFLHVGCYTVNSLAMSILA